MKKSREIFKEYTFEFGCIMSSVHPSGLFKESHCTVNYADRTVSLISDHSVIYFVETPSKNVTSLSTDAKRKTFYSVALTLTTI